MGLIDNHDRIRFQIRLIHKFPQQHTISHIFNHSILTSIILKSNRISNFLPQFDSHLLSHSGSHTHSSYSSWLSASNFSLSCVTNFMKILWQLGCFARTCLADHDDYLVISNQLEKLFSVFKNWERLFY